MCEKIKQYNKKLEIVNVDIKKLDLTTCCLRKYFIYNTNMLKVKDGKRDIM